MNIMRVNKKTSGKILRSHEKFELYRAAPVRPRGRGAKFQWNSEAEYVISFYRLGEPLRKFKTLAEADKEWVYLVLKHS